MLCSVVVFKQKQERFLYAHTLQYENSSWISKDDLLLVPSVTASNIGNCTPRNTSIDYEWKCGINLWLEFERTIQIQGFFSSSKLCID